MRLRTLLLSGGILIVVSPAYAQQQQSNPVERSLMLALEMQKIGAATQQAATDMQTLLTASRARIAELEKLCGDRCTPEAREK